MAATYTRKIDGLRVWLGPDEAEPGLGGEQSGGEAHTLVYGFDFTKVKAAPTVLDDMNSIPAGSLIEKVELVFKDTANALQVDVELVDVNNSAAVTALLAATTVTAGSVVTANPAVITTTDTYLQVKADVDTTQGDYELRVYVTR